MILQYSWKLGFRGFGGSVWFAYSCIIKVYVEVFQFLLCAFLSIFSFMIPCCRNKFMEWCDMWNQWSVISSLCSHNVTLKYTTCFGSLWFLLSSASASAAYFRKKWCAAPFFAPRSARSFEMFEMSSTSGRTTTALRLLELSSRADDVSSLVFRAHESVEVFWSHLQKREGGCLQKAWQNGRVWDWYVFSTSNCSSVILYELLTRPYCNENPLLL